MLAPRLAQAGLLIVLAGHLGAWIAVAQDETQREITLAACFSTDGRLLAHSTNRGVAVFDLPTGQSRRLDASGQVALTPDGQYLVSGDANGLTVWDWRQGRPLFSQSSANRAAVRIAVSADSTQVAGADDRSLRLWDLPNGNLVVTIPLPQAQDRVAFSPDGKFVLAAGTTQVGGKKAHAIRLWTVPGGVPQAVLIGPEYCYVRSFAVSPDGKTLASGLSTNAVRLWDIESRKELWKADEIGTDYDALAFSLDGKRLIVGGFGEATVLDPARPDARSFFRLPNVSVNAVAPGFVAGEFLLAAGDGVYTVAPERGAITLVHQGLTLRSRTLLATNVVTLLVWLSLWTLTYLWIRGKLPRTSARAERYAWLVVSTTACLFAVHWAGVLMIVWTDWRRVDPLLVGAAISVLWLMALVVLAILSLVFARGVTGISCALFSAIAIVGQLGLTLFAMVQALAQAG